MKKLFVLVLLLMVFILFSCGVKGEDKMFVSIYNRDKEHLANVEINKYTITKKVFDLDVSNFEGHSDIDITDGLLFVFKDNSGKQIYAGFMK
jgi:hypothetical protein